MSYFRLICLFLAALTLFARILFPIKKSRSNASLKAFPVNRPVWIDVTAFIVFVVTAVTWQKLLAAPATGKWIVTIFMSLTFIKMLLWMFLYPFYRKMALSIFNEGRRLMLINIASFTAFVAFLAVAFIYF